MNFPIYFPAIMIPARYFIIAGLFFSIFYISKKNYYSHLKIQQAFPSKKTIYSELLFSLLTLIIFTIIAYIMFYLNNHNYTKIYRNISDYGVPYLLFSTLFLIIFHDFYFYITHRIMHYKKLFFVHKRHHLSVNPTPWAAFSFSPIEAVVQIIWIPLIALFVPLHFYALMVWSFFMMIMNVIGHLGYEIFPKNFLDSFIGKILLSSTHHNLHHSRNKSNFGLYFTFWDRILGTEDENYRLAYEKIKKTNPL
jgi:sterol desaturase/sphingolipid hydroxylase (fatty acid hydroxylase superfamily)